MRKPVFAICEQQRRRSACASAWSAPLLFVTYTCYSRNFKTLASLFSWADRFESYLVKNPKDRFSHDEAHFKDALSSKMSWLFTASLQSVILKKTCYQCKKYGVLAKSICFSLELLFHLSHITRKSVFRVCDQVRLKPACSTTETR